MNEDRPFIAECSSEDVEKSLCGCFLTHDVHDLDCFEFHMNPLWQWFVKYDSITIFGSLEMVFSANCLYWQTKPYNDQDKYKQTETTKPNQNKFTHV